MRREEGLCFPVVSRCMVLSQEEIVKLQTVNLAAKLCIANAKQSRLLCQYVLNLAKYDLNYDIRDRARFLQKLVLPKEVSWNHFPDSEIRPNTLSNG